MPEGKKGSSASALAMYRVAGKQLYVVGTFDTGVTVYSQQARALNLVWALIDEEEIPSPPAGSARVADPSFKVAIVGAGFAGLSIAAGLIKKGASAHITIFEERDTLLPLQQGSDSRWLHPRIYDWPAEGSEASAAMLPVLNWTAARASDVVVQILSEWKSTVRAEKPKLDLYCNARHLQIHEECESPDKLRIEWIGEHRNPEDGTIFKSTQIATKGASENFDVVILAVGFGLEADDPLFSYWPNETFGQPSLDQPRRTYLVSGQGDGAMIDLLRLRISAYRQDRILDDLFHRKGELIQVLRSLHEDYSKAVPKTGLFNELERLESNEHCAVEFAEVRDALASRLRRDTEAILHLKVRKLAELFEPATTRISFQNKLLVYFLYKCGAFVPSSEDESRLLQQHSIPPAQVIHRHGTLREQQLKRVLHEDLYNEIQKRRGGAMPDPFSQPQDILWMGGYFDFYGPSKHRYTAPDPIKAHWRKEYLPGPTALLATTFCSSVAGVLRGAHPEGRRLRVTLHRTLILGEDDELLQQSCDYFGTDDAKGETQAARTFPARNATIGLAYRCRRIVRSIRNVRPEQLAAAMRRLNLNEASQAMSAEVSFVLAIPILQPEDRFIALKPVAGIIYIDSTAPTFFIEDEGLRPLVSMTNLLIYGLENPPLAKFDRIRNVPLKGLRDTAPARDELPNDIEVRDALELVDAIAAPRSSKEFQFNFDCADFVAVEG